ncbi:MAG: hypothetical protein ACLQBX_14170 [Candidatus Limnocylindrales bacterium]
MFIARAEEDSRGRLGRGLTAEELERVLRRYPGNPETVVEHTEQKTEVGVGAVQEAVRRTFHDVPVTLHTVGQAKPFVFSDMDTDGIALLLGEQRTRTPISWACLESVVPFLRDQGGWVPTGGARSVRGEPGTLDQHLTSTT